MRKKWPKTLTKVKHDHSAQAAASQTPGEHNNSCILDNTSSYLTVLESRDLQVQCNKVTTVGSMTCFDSDKNVQDASTSTVETSTRDIGIEVSTYFSIESIMHDNHLVHFILAFQNFPLSRYFMTFWENQFIT